MLIFFFFNDTATTEIYTLSLHDALPIFIYGAGVGLAISQLTSTVLQSIPWQKAGVGSGANNTVRQIDRKSTRLNSSHLVISYAVFCLKKKIHEDLSDTYEFRFQPSGQAP